LSESPDFIKKNAIEGSLKTPENFSGVFISVQFGY